MRAGGWRRTLAGVKHGEPEPRAGLAGWQKTVLLLLVFALAGSIALRAARGPSAGGEPSSPGNARSLVAAPGEQAAEDAPALERALPWITEGSLFALIGFALGYATRKVFKLALLVIAVAFLAVQALVHFGVLEVGWGGVVDALNRVVLNLKADESVTGFLTRRVPSAGALLAGVVIGFRRG